MVLFSFYAVTDTKVTVVTPEAYIGTCDVIMPHGTRRRLCRALALLRNKELENPWKKHDNLPL